MMTINKRTRHCRCAAPPEERRALFRKTSPSLPHFTIICWGNAMKYCVRLEYFVKYCVEKEYCTVKYTKHYPNTIEDLRSTAWRPLALPTVPLLDWPSQALGRRRRRCQLPTWRCIIGRMEVTRARWVQGIIDGVLTLPITLPVLKVRHNLLVTKTGIRVYL